MLLAGGDHPLSDLVEYSAMKLMIGIGVLFFSSVSLSRAQQ